MPGTVSKRLPADGVWRRLTSRRTGGRQVMRDKVPCCGLLMCLCRVKRVSLSLPLCVCVCACLLEQYVWTCAISSRHCYIYKCLPQISPHVLNMLPSAIWVLTSPYTCTYYTHLDTYRRYLNVYLRRIFTRRCTKRALHTRAELHSKQRVWAYPISFVTKAITTV